MDLDRKSYHRLLNRHSRYRSDQDCNPRQEVSPHTDIPNPHFVQDFVHDLVQAQDHHFTNTTEAHYDHAHAHFLEEEYHFLNTYPDPDLKSPQTPNYSITYHSRPSSRSRSHKQYSMSPQRHSHMASSRSPHRSYSRSPKRSKTSIRLRSQDKVSRSPSPRKDHVRRCYACGSTDHLVAFCQKKHSYQPKKLHSMDTAIAPSHNHMHDSAARRSPSAYCKKQQGMASKAHHPNTKLASAITRLQYH